MTNNQELSEPDAEAAGKKIGGEVSERNKSEWNPKGGELFVHSHFFESVDGAERHGLEDVLDRDAVELFQSVIEFRDANNITDDLIVPAGNKKLVSFYESSMRRLLQNRQETVGAKQGEDRFVVGEGSVAIEPADGSASLAVEVGDFPKKESARNARFKRKLA